MEQTLLQPRRIAAAIDTERDDLYSAYKRLKRERVRCQKRYYLHLARLPRRYWLTAAVDIKPGRVDIYFSDTNTSPDLKRVSDDPAHGHAVLLGESLVYVRLTGGRVTVNKGNFRPPLRLDTRLCQRAS